MDSNTVLLPFYGTKVGDFSPFQYLPLEFNFNDEDGVGRILLPNWAVSREVFKEGDIINLQIGIAANNKTYSHAIIAGSQYDDSLDGTVYQLRLNRDNNKVYFVLLHATEKHSDAENSQGAIFKIDLASFSNAHDLLLASVKDCWMLKRGIGIYLSHLIPYFSRITNFSRSEYPLLKKTLLEEPIERTSENANYLERLFEDLAAQPIIKGSDGNMLDLLPQDFDMNAFASSLGSELELDLFELSFDSELALTYLKSIKNLEGRLFFNHNVVLALYTQELLQ